MALVSGLLHRMTAETSRSILHKIYAGMVPGGQVIVSDLFTLDGEPELAVLFGLQVLLTNETGGAHDARDVTSWLSAIGFVDVTVTSLFPHMAIMARPAPRFCSALYRRSALLIVQPGTVVVWHGQGFKLYWRWKSRKKPGRPPGSGRSEGLWLGALTSWSSSLPE